MAQNFVPKQTNFVTKYTSLVQAFLDICDSINEANAEFTADAYGTGGANALTDTICESVLPALTATLFNEAEGAMVTILSTVASNRGYLEICRP